jgi:hypothetical protein
MGEAILMQRRKAQGDVIPNLIGELTFSGLYANSLYLIESDCSMGCNADGEIFIMVRGANNSNYENIVFEAGTLPDGVALAQTTYYTHTSNTTSNHFGCKLTGVTNKLNVDVELRILNPSYDNVLGTVSAEYYQPPSTDSLLYDGGTNEENWVVGYSEGDGSQSKEADHLYLLAAQSNGTAERTYVLDYKVDVTDYTVLKIDWEDTVTGTSTNKQHAVCLSDVKTGSMATYDYRLYREQSFERTIDSLDISLVSGEYYIRVHGRDNYASGTRSGEVKAYKIWLE